MIKQIEDDVPAFPRNYNANGHNGMWLRDYFAGQALSNPALCTGSASDFDLINWFGRNRSGISAQEIAAAQAYSHADAMIAARKGDAS